jgi:hypothetical protein
MDDWAKSAISFGSGVLTSGLIPYVHQYVRAWQFRRLLYYEITWLYRALVVGVSVIEENYTDFDPVVADIKRSFTFVNFKYAKQNLEVFHLLKEAHHIDRIYGQLQILLEPFNGSSEYIPRMKYVIRSIEERIRENDLDARTLVKTCPANMRKVIENLAYRNGPLSFQAEYDRMERARGQRPQ